MFVFTIQFKSMQLNKVRKFNDDPEILRKLGAKKANRQTQRLSTLGCNYYYYYYF